MFSRLPVNRIIYEEREESMCFIVFCYLEKTVLYHAFFYRYLHLKKNSFRGTCKIYQLLLIPIYRQFTDLKVNYYL